MTHDELLAKLNNDENGWAGSTPVQRRNALRAVVELHKPIIFPQDARLWCDNCYSEGELYPCTTIRAIESKLI